MRGMPQNAANSRISLHGMLKKLWFPGLLCMSCLNMLQMAGFFAHGRRNARLSSACKPPHAEILLLDRNVRQEIHLLVPSKPVSPSNSLENYRHNSKVPHANYRQNIPANFCWAGKSHPWTKASVGGNFRRTFRTIGPYEFPQEKVWTNDWSIWISPEICMDQWRSQFSESFSVDRHWSIECSSLLGHW